MDTKPSTVNTNQDQNDVDDAAGRETHTTRDAGSERYNPGAPTAFFMKMPAIVILNKKPLSLSKEGNVDRLGIDSEAQCEFKIKLDYSPNKNPRITMHVFHNDRMTEHGEIRRRVFLGRVSIFFESMSEVICTRFSREDTVAYLASHFEQPIDVRSGSLYLSFKASKPEVLLHKTRVGPAPAAIREQITRLSTFAESIKKSPSRLEFLVEDDHVLAMPPALDPSDVSGSSFSLPRYAAEDKQETYAETVQIDGSEEFYPGQPKRGIFSLISRIAKDCIKTDNSGYLARASGPSAKKIRGKHPPREPLSDADISILARINEYVRVVFQATPELGLSTRDPLLGSSYIAQYAEATSGQGQGYAHGPRGPQQNDTYSTKTHEQHSG
ncbi:hypothetical protein GGS26DRAFT_414443 [Hypomontagnella submonticulosa]|nr:hypothetical protein GGS26DRAFT_414443 [Hypomontagnella submonticulosa]